MKKQGHCCAKAIGRTPDTMEFRSKSDQLIDHANDFTAWKKRKNDEEGDGTRV